MMKTGVLQDSVLSPLLRSTNGPSTETSSTRNGVERQSLWYRHICRRHRRGYMLRSRAATINRCKVPTNSSQKLNAAKSEVVVVSWQLEQLHSDAGGQELKQVEQSKYH